MSTGRKEDPVWRHFSKLQADDKKIRRAKCKRCNKEMVGLVKRMKKHSEVCETESADEEIVESDEIHSANTTSAPRIVPAEDGQDQIQPISIQNQSILPFSTSVKTPSKFHQPSISTFAIKTSKAEKQNLNRQVAKFIYATNSAFRSVEHPEFMKLMDMLRPGYKPPSRFQIAGDLLDEVHASLQDKMREQLMNKTVCMQLDGWSNIHNESIICLCVSDASNGSVYLVNTVDTEDNNHNYEYLSSLAAKAIKETSDTYGCKIRSFVTDNASNMGKMRTNLAQVLDLKDNDIITYGCSSHLLNLLAGDLAIPKVDEHIKQIIKYFRQTHFSAAKYKKAGGKKLQLPCDTRWNSLKDSIGSYIENWHILVKVCDENRSAIDSKIISKVSDLNLKNNAIDYHNKLQKIAAALDAMQSATCTIGHATELWICLLEDFEKDFSKEYDACKKRFCQALTSAHFLANLLDPRYCGKKLNNAQIDEALSFINIYHPTAMAEIILYRAKATPFNDYLFAENVLKKVKPADWWKALGSRISEDLRSLVIQLHTAVPASAGLERLFSTFGLVHNKLRNRLGVEKAGKLVYIFKLLNNFDATDGNEVLMLDK